MMTIRRRLLLLLLPALAALMLLGGIADYRVAVVTTRDAYDRALASAAMALAADVHRDEQPLRFSWSAARGLLDGSAIFAVVGPDRDLLAGTPELARSMPESAHPGARTRYWDAQINGQAWRAAGMLLPTAGGPVTIAVAETLERRARTQQVLLIGKLLVDFAELDLTLLLIWIAVYYGTRPLDELTAEVGRHSPRELQRLDESRVPGELRPLIVAFNRLLELLHSAAQSQQRFVADAAHQMRTPVAGLLAQLELLQHDAGASAVAPQLNSLHRGIQQLARSANQMLALARAEPVAQERFIPVSLKTLVEQLVERYLDRADQAGIDLGADTMPVSVAGDPGRLEDLLENLIDNALKYAPRGGHVTVRCGLEKSSPYLEVEDDGPGIPEADRLRVRERFFRLPGSTGIGCGLGLAIVEEIARVHDAVLFIGSGADGRGARLRVRFSTAPPP